MSETMLLNVSSPLNSMAQKSLRRSSLYDFQNTNNFLTKMALARLPPRKLYAKQYGILLVIFIIGYSIFQNAGFLQFTTSTEHITAYFNSSHVEVFKDGEYQSSVGKVHAVFGDPNPTYERALRLHQFHSEKMGHPMFVLREKVLSGLWSKPAYILSIIVQELAMPEDLRLKWLLWNDADIVLMNSNISLDIFVPPSPEFDYVNMLATNDRHGLNNGCFLIRVCDWSVKLLSGVIAFHDFKPEIPLKYTEQSALEEMIEDRVWRRAVVKVPQFLFNSYPPADLDSDKVLNEKEPKAHEFRPGGLQIHFVSNRNGQRMDRMNYWMDVAERYLPEWNGGESETFYREALAGFWGELSAKRKAKGITSQ